MAVSQLLPFLLASMALTLAPGPDNLFVVTQGMSRGQRPALITAWGMCSGVMVHTLAAALGASAVFYTSAVVFTGVKFLGAAYLLYLAWQAWRFPPQLNTADPGATAWALPGGVLFRRGMLMNLLNPKVALFFLAFLPQFVRSGAPLTVFSQMVVLGLVFMLQALLLMSLFALAAGYAGMLLQRHSQVGSWLGRLSAAVLAALGLRLLFASR